ncbi:MAG: MarR family transcriptional regulator [Bacilli bacterium]|nr:MarR family transcriptional regulator [Bacilli bacterium]
MEKNFESLYLKNQVCFPTYAVANKILRRYQPLLKELDLTYTQYITMMVMWEKRKVNEKDLVEALYLKANTLTDLLKKLEAKGYVEISKDKEDKRNIIISLTDKGLALREKAVDIPSCIYEDHWLTDEEFAVFKKLLEKMLKGNW